MLSGFDALKTEMGSSRGSSMARGVSLDVSYDEKDLMKVGTKMCGFPMRF